MKLEQDHAKKSRLQIRFERAWFQSFNIAIYEGTHTYIPGGVDTNKNEYFHPDVNRAWKLWLQAQPVVFIQTDQLNRMYVASFSSHDSRWSEPGSHVTLQERSPTLKPTVDTVRRLSEILTNAGCVMVVENRFDQPLS